MKLNPYAGPLAVLWAASLLGCSVEPETLDSLRAAVSQVSNPADASVFAQAGLGGEGLAADSAPTRFVPPHPDRVDPFHFPDAVGRPNQVAAGTTSVAEIEVLGFAHVNEPRVLLRTRAATRSLAVGDSVEGIEVVAINPPAVELKLGSLTWITTLFGKSTNNKN